MIAALVTGVAAAGIVTVPGTRIETYPVSGGDVAAIRASLAEREPIDRNDGVRVAAITHWRYRWRWPGTAGGPCRLSDATVRFSATVTLPRLVGVTALPPGVQAEWRRYRNALAAHEGNHLHRAYTHRGEVLTAIRRASCATAGAAARAVLRTLIEHDLAYDRDTQHGASEGAVFAASRPTVS